MVAQGKLGADGTFHASEVLAKHDENYMPPEAADALRKARPPDRQGGLRGPGRQAMIPELGHFALVVALALALAQGVLSLAGARHRTRALDRHGAPDRDRPVPVRRRRVRRARRARS